MRCFCQTRPEQSHPGVRFAPFVRVPLHFVFVELLGMRRFTLRFSSKEKEGADVNNTKNNNKKKDKPDPKENNGDTNNNNKNSARRSIETPPSNNNTNTLGNNNNNSHYAALPGAIANKEEGSPKSKRYSWDGMNSNHSTLKANRIDPALLARIASGNDTGRSDHDYASLPRLVEMGFHKANKDKVRS